MNARIVTGIIIGAGLLFSGILYAQQTPTMKLGESVSGAATAKGGDLYQFIGLSGTQLQARLKLPGSGVLTLYSPDGEELTRIEGENSIVLNARLNENAMYFIGIIRSQPGAAYSLALDGQIIEQGEPFAEAATLTAPPEAPVVPAAPEADPAKWGLYAQLLGDYRQAAGGYKLHWRWETPQQVLIEEWINPVTGKVAHANTLRPGTAPGSLELDASHPGGDRSGKVTEDGSVEFLGKGFFKKPYRMQLLSNGDLEMQSLQIRDGVTKVTGSQRFTVLVERETGHDNNERRRLELHEKRQAEQHARQRPPAGTAPKRAEIDSRQALAAPQTSQPAKPELRQTPQAAPRTSVTPDATAVRPVSNTVVAAPAAAPAGRAVYIYCQAYAPGRAKGGGPQFLMTPIGKVHRQGTAAETAKLDNAFRAYVTQRIGEKHNISCNGTFDADEAARLRDRAIQNLEKGIKSSGKGEIVYLTWTPSD